MFQTYVFLFNFTPKNNLFLRDPGCDVDGSTDGGWQKKFECTWMSQEVSKWLVKRL